MFTPGQKLKQPEESKKELLSPQTRMNLNQNKSDGGGGIPKAEEQPVEISAFQLDDEEDEPLKQPAAADAVEEEKKDSVQR